MAALSGVAVLAVVAFLGGLVAARTTGDASPAEVAPAAGPVALEPHVFAPLTLPGGLVLARTWTVEDGGTTLRGVTAVSNDGRSPVRTGVDEVVPKSVAADVADLALTPTPDEVVAADPVVRYVVSLDPGERQSWTFVATLREPVTTAARLADLAADGERARAAHEADLARAGAARLLRLSVSPATVRLQPGQEMSVVVTGRLADGRVVPGAQVPGISVRSANTNVVQTLGVRLRGRAPGRAFVVAQAGEVRTQVLVVVLAPVAAPPPPPLPTPVPAAPSVRPSPTARPTPTVRPTPRRTTAPARPATTRPAPAPTRTAAAPRPSRATPAPAPSRTTAAPRASATRSPTRAPSPRPTASSPRPRPTF